MTTFGQRLHKTMNEKGMKQIELSKLTNIHIGTINNWLNDRYTPKIDKIIILAKALGVEYTYLAGYDDVLEQIDDYTNNRLITKQKISSSACITLQENKDDLLKKLCNCSFEKFEAILKILQITDKQAEKISELIDVMFK